MGKGGGCRRWNLFCLLTGQAVPRKFHKVFFFGLFVLLAAAGCSATSPSLVNPKGPAAARVTTLTWILFMLGGLVFLAVMAFLLVALFRRRHDDAIDTGKERLWITLTGVVATVILLLVVYALTLNVLDRVSAAPGPSQVSIRVIAHQWWWQIEYPGEGVITANEIHIPVGQSVLLDLRTPDVIHSFWVPQLHGKRDIIPGMVNAFWIQADEPGVFRGECAEFCGAQHAKMQFVVVAESREEFDAWIENQQRAAEIPQNAYYEQGLNVFLQAGCGGCHTIQGTQAVGVTGPNLTHVASRLTLAAGALENNKANLGGWVANPQGIKPGNKMPNIHLPSEDFRALIDFLTILE